MFDMARCIWELLTVNIKTDSGSATRSFFLPLKISLPPEILGRGAPLCLICALCQSLSLPFLLDIFFEGLYIFYAPFRPNPFASSAIFIRTKVLINADLHRLRSRSSLPVTIYRNSVP